MKLGYAYRADGNFLIRRVCVHCGEEFDVHAAANTKPDDYGHCPACYAVSQMEREVS